MCPIRHKSARQKCYAAHRQPRPTLQPEKLRQQLHALLQDFKHRHAWWAAHLEGTLRVQAASPAALRTVTRPDLPAADQRSLWRCMHVSNPFRCGGRRRAGSVPPRCGLSVGQRRCHRADGAGGMRASGPRAAAAVCGLRVATAAGPGGGWCAAAAVRVLPACGRAAAVVATGTAEEAGWAGADAGRTAAGARGFAAGTWRAGAGAWRAAAGRSGGGASCGGGELSHGGGEVGHSSRGGSSRGG